MRDVYVTIETWSFACLRCGNTWDVEYEARRTCDMSGTEVVTWRCRGLACVPPWTGRACPSCAGLRVKPLPRSSAPHDAPHDAAQDARQPPEPRPPADGPLASQTSTRPPGSVSAILR